jgi:tetratricopeptide (TPR) repeat protein
MTNAYMSRSRAYSLIDKVNQSIADLSKAIEIDPNLPDAYCIRGSVYSSMGKRALAIADLTNCLALDPNRNNMDEILKMISALK